MRLIIIVPRNEVILWRSQNWWGSLLPR